ncbi:MAG: erythromycin esterase family protein [Gemmatimonadaceae bacterium]
MSLLRRSIVMLPLVFAACITEQDVVQNTTVLGVPQGWQGNFDNRAGIGLTGKDTHSGIAAVYMSGQANFPTNALLLQTVNASAYLGKRVRLSAWLKPVDLSAEYAGLWMRVDGGYQTLSFDNMHTRPISGRGPWRQESIVLDVANDAVGITFGALFLGVGTMEVDDMLLEVVGNEIPTTDMFSGPTPPDTISRTPIYASSRDVPQNMGFEGSPAVSDKTISWIAGNAVSLTTTDPRAPLTDVAAFGEMVGSAHVVGLGEGTHGTREFNLVKHRYIRQLVESKGFTHVAIEGAAADAELINQYVLTGQGDPATLLSGLRFWINNTQEMLDLINWIRQWNTTASVSARVRFYGFDFQQPAGQLDSVEKYIARVDTANVAFVRTRYLCFDPYKSYGATYGAPIAAYAARLATSRAACAVGAQDVHDLLANSSVAYKSRATADEYERALHSARLVQQWEAFATRYSSSNLSSASISRDSSMFENVQWIKSRASANAKIILWAHNDHVMRTGNLMGARLARAFGNDYVAVGFTFGSGVLNAVYNGSVQAIRPTSVPNDWVEARFGSAKPSNFLLDLRKVATGGADAAALKGPLVMRNIGSTYLLTSPSGFPRIYYLPDDFDLITYIHSANATTLLPFVF